MNHDRDTPNPSSQEALALRDPRSPLRGLVRRIGDELFATRAGLAARLRGDAPADSSCDAVVFSSYVPDERALEIATGLLRVFERRYADCHVYVGINRGSRPEWAERLRQSPLAVRIAEVPEARVVDSDAAGFQSALTALRADGRSHRLVWFAHTKGAVNDRPDQRRSLVRRFLERRGPITRLFRHPRVGAYGHTITAGSDFAAYADACLERIVALDLPAIGTHYVDTFYVLRAEIVERFLRACAPEFFEGNLVRDLGFDRYFFEGVFCTLAEKAGYYPLYRERWTLPGESVAVTRERVRALYRSWEANLPPTLRARVPIR